MDNLLLSDMTVGHPNAYEIGLNKGQSTEVEEANPQKETVKR